MQLESIKLENFRQFRSANLDFATGDNGKNVTIIMGGNGTGKTTFEQAFFWCMYGRTGFSDKSMLNKQKEIELLPGQEAKVLVELKLKHRDVAYTLTREQLYSKEYSGKLTSLNTSFNIAKKGVSGNTEFLRPFQCEAEVMKILPKELSHYFFFDGERIEKISKDISAEKKSTDFADAVKGLLGLDAIISAIGHLNPRSKNSVIGSYESSYDSKSNDKVQKYTQTIERCREKLNEIDASLLELDDEIEKADVRLREKRESLKQYDESKLLQERREQLEKEIDATQKMKTHMIKEICDVFNRQQNSFFSVNMMKRTLEFMSARDFTGKDIPFMHAKTIEYLLEQGECICGTCLHDGTSAYQKVKDLFEFLPPQSISSAISDFKKEAILRAKNNNNLQALIKDKLGIISSENDDINDKQEEIDKIEKKLSSGNVEEKIRSISSEIKECERIISNDRDKKISILAERKLAEQEQLVANTQRKELTLLDEKNRKIEIYKAYAERIYSELNDAYIESERKVRNELEETINAIFKKLYNGGLSLSIDEKYHISVTVNDYEGYVETSTAQSISVIFAFITAIIKMVRKHKADGDEDAKLLSAEPYPLVMDAPLSTFDKSRIQAVCETLPEVAEQVIIFIKDTDGEYVEKFMEDRIGCRHQFEKQNEFETTIV